MYIIVFFGLSLWSNNLQKSSEVSTTSFFSHLDSTPIRTLKKKRCSSLRVGDSFFSGALGPSTIVGTRDVVSWDVRSWVELWSRSSQIFFRVFVFQELAAVRNILLFSLFFARNDASLPGFVLAFMSARAKKETKPSNQLNFSRCLRMLQIRKNIT